MARSAKTSLPKAAPTLELLGDEDIEIYTPPLNLLEIISMQVSTNKNIEKYIKTTQGGSASAGVYILMLVFKDLKDLLGNPKEARNLAGAKWYNSTPSTIKGPHKLYFVKAAFTILYGLVKGGTGSSDQIKSTLCSYAGRVGNDTNTC